MKSKNFITNLFILVEIKIVLILTKSVKSVCRFNFKLKVIFLVRSTSAVDSFFLFLTACTFGHLFCKI